LKIVLTTKYQQDSFEGQVREDKLIYLKKQTQFFKESLEAESVVQTYVVGEEVA
jgi:hypothetical protein